MNWASRVGRVCPQAGITGTKPREAYGVRGACSRFRTAPHIRQREQAPRTPYASRDTTALVIRLCNLIRIARKSAQKNKIFAYIIQRAAVQPKSQPGALRTGAPYLSGYSLDYSLECVRKHLHDSTIRRAIFHGDAQRA